MFSATWPKEVQDLAMQYCSMAPVQIQIGKENASGGLTCNDDIEQVIHCLDSNYQKYEKLLDLLL